MVRYQETVGILYAMNHFYFQHLEFLSAFTASVPIGRLQTIPHMGILYSPSCRRPSETVMAISSMKSLKQLDIVFYPGCLSTTESHLLDMLGLMRKDIAVTLYLGSPSRRILAEVDARGFSHVQPHLLKTECSRFTQRGRLDRIM
jgi:hypothetical protein